MANPPSRPSVSPGLRLAIDIAPLAVFFVVNFLTPGPQIARLLAATAAFMVASAIAMIVSRWKTGHISPMLWMTGTLVLVFGGLTLYFHDETFIKLKPTFVYSMFAAILAFGLATGRPLLQSLLQAAYPGLTARGWRQLTINWTIFFVVHGGAERGGVAQHEHRFLGRVQALGRDSADPGVRDRQHSDADEARAEHGRHAAGDTAGGVIFLAPPLQGRGL